MLNEPLPIASQSPSPEGDGKTDETFRFVTVGTRLSRVRFAALTQSAQPEILFNVIFYTEPVFTRTLIDTAHCCFVIGAKLRDGFFA